MAGQRPALNEDNVNLLHRIAVIVENDNELATDPVEVLLRAYQEGAGHTDPDHPIARYVASLADVKLGQTPVARFQTLMAQDGLSLEYETESARLESEEPLDPTRERDPDETEEEYQARLDAWLDQEPPGLMERAMLYDKEKLLRPVLQLWREKVKKHEEDRRRADAMYKKNLLLKALCNWRAKIRHIQEMEAQAVEFRRQQDLKLAARFLGNLQTKTQEHRKAEQRADDFRYFYDTSRALSKLRDVTERRKAIKARTVEVWKGYTALRKQKRLKIVGDAVKQWRQFTKRSVHEKLSIRYKEFRLKWKKKMVRDILDKWRMKVRKVKEMEKMADEFYERQTRERVRKILYKWYEKTMTMREQRELADQFYRRNLLRRIDFSGKARTQLAKIQHMEQMADQFRLNKDMEKAEKALKKLSLKGFEVTQQERMADDFRARWQKKRTEAFVRQAIGRWRAKVAEKRGEGPLDLPPVTPAARRAAALQELSTTTPAYTPGATSLAARLRAARHGAAA